MVIPPKVTNNELKIKFSSNNTTTKYPVLLHREFHLRSII